jgi:hypothetical protein
MRLVPPSWGHPKLPTPGCKVLTEQERSEISISGGSRPPTVSQSGEVEVSAVIDNGSSTWLRSTGDHPIHFSGRWLDSNGVVLEGDAERNALVGGIPPGKRREVVGIFRAVPGATAVRLTLVQEHIAWFDEQAVAAEVRLP